IMVRFEVPNEFQQKALLFGIAAALLLRAVLIAIGAAAISLFSFTFLFFGLVLIWTAIQLIKHRNEEPDVQDNFLVRRARKLFPISDDYHGGRMLARENGRRVATPLLLVFVAIGSTDLLFALDSIPASFGVPQDPCVVLRATALAPPGLRALCFRVAGLLDRLVYLTIGRSAILIYLGAKLILQFVHEDISTSVPEMPTPLSLVVIVLILAVPPVASLLRVRPHPEEQAKPRAIRVALRK